MIEKRDTMASQGLCCVLIDETSWRRGTPCDALPDSSVHRSRLWACALQTARGVRMPASC